MGELANKTHNFQVELPDELRWRRDRALSRAGKTKSAKTHRESLRIAEDLKRAIALSEEYHAETARLREISGIDGILAKRKAAIKRMDAAMDAIASIRATTINGTITKALAIEEWRNTEGPNDKVIAAFASFKWTRSIADDLLHMHRES